MSGVSTRGDCMELNWCSVMTQRSGKEPSDREAQEEGDMCLHLADLPCCTTEDNATL